LRGKTDMVKRRFEEASGALVDDNKLRADGNADQAVGKDKQAAQTAVDEDTHQPRQRLRPLGDMVEYCRRYAREKPAVVALASLGLGFALAWKLKP